MTPSQLAAFEGIVDHGLRLVWGPPGTGKTHFLALAVLCLAEAHRAAGESFRTLLTAFTHAAIDNALRKAAELQDRHRHRPRRRFPSQSSATPGWRGWRRSGPSRPRPARPAGVGPTTSRSPCAAAPSGRSTRAKARTGPTSSSSTRARSSASRSRRSCSGDCKAGARLLIAGDDKQLPPIVQATYPDPEPGEPILHRSLFECLKAQDPDRPVHRDAAGELADEPHALHATRPSRSTRPAYRSATPEIASRRLILARPGKDADVNALADALVDPDYPLVIGVLDGVRAAAENRVEADLVARAVVRLRSRLQPAPRRRYPDSREGDEAFWKDGLFVVSPHHVQIAAIRRALDAAREWQGQPFRRDRSTASRARNARPSSSATASRTSSRR